ncbi:MAG: PSD1 domain-containing protein [Planctomycetes bacterium]|nr:PSD1 domain-containing protein [Planctomycetota bacterium]
MPRILIAWVSSVLSVCVPQLAARADEVDFVRDVQPLLAAHCTACHGAQKSKADLRLDLRERALAGAWGGTEPAIVPGKSAQSPLYLRLLSDDPDERMPHKAAALDARQIELIRRWIDAGATWPDSAAGADPRVSSHWSYAKPARPPVPRVAHPERVRNALDAFIEARLEREGLTPLPEADRATLLRRLALDLNGLPPSTAELDEFERDRSPEAYERAVRRLLASPHFGERMARPWLDLARYADTQGYEKDARRSMWRYRDWVIAAFNANMPFDRFSVLQLAGDLLPGATLEERIATGFHRNTMLNEEGGTDPEEFRVDAVLDRVNTTATVWMGTTLACAQCHEHKYDPFSQRDYYRVFAVFNSTADSGRESAPMIAAPRADEARTLDELERGIAEARARFDGLDAGLDAEQARWEQAVTPLLPPPTRWTTLFPRAMSAAQGSLLAAVSDGSILASGPAPDRETYELTFPLEMSTFGALRLETLPDDGLGGVASRAEHGNFVLSTLEAEIVPQGGVAPVVPIHFATAEGDVEQSNGPFRAASSLDVSPETGWAIGGHDVREPHEALFASREAIEVPPGAALRVRLHFESRYARHVLGRFRISLTDDPVLVRRMTTPVLSPWRAVGPFRAQTFELARDTIFPPEAELLAGRPFSPSYDAEHLAWVEEARWTDRSMVRLDGDRCATYLARTIFSESERQLELFVGGDDSLRVWLNGSLVHGNDDYQSLLRLQDRVLVRLRAGDNLLVMKVVNGGGGYGFYFDIGRRTDDRRSAEAERALRSAPQARSASDARALREWFRRYQSRSGAQLWAELTRLERERDELRAKVPTALVMEELPSPRETRLFVRGSFLTPGDAVQPGIPALFGTLEQGAAPARLAFARWLVSEDNPLVARVTVNRLWELVFGRGLVATVQDFGTRGDAPSHPELLDWLAVEFIESGWDVQHVLQLIVGSAAYRRSSDASADAFARDPENVLLARGPRFRVEAEMLRDIALASSGLLVHTLGGPSVFPPQPPGTWNSAYSGDDWQEDLGENRHRRALYTFAKRTAPYVTHALFEAPSREVTCPRRARTNTPLQALALLDDPAFVEAAVALAARMCRETAGDAAGIEAGFRSCTSRRPTTPELDILRSLLADARRHFASDPESARARVEGCGADELDPLELAAWSSVASVILNLDDTTTKR